MRGIRRRHARAVAFIALTVACSVAVVATSVGPAAAGAPITGSGSTFAMIAIEEWRAASARKLGLQVNYAGAGSSAGRRSFIEGSVDFASSDISFEPGENPSRAFTYLPLVAGGTALMYNLKDTTGAQIRDLKMSGSTIAGIFFNTISSWNDPRIAADNPHLAGKLPAAPIKPAARSGGSGTTAVFTGYLAAVDPGAWDAFAAAYGSVGGTDYIRPGARFTSTFPVLGVGGFGYFNGSDGIANFVAQSVTGQGAIGYAEVGYAIQRDLPMVSVKNAAGRFVQPTARNQAIALTQAARNPDGTQNLTKAYFHDDPDSYPVSSYNYLIAPTALTNGFTVEKGETLGRFIIYSVTEGQAKAEPLGYSPLPPNLVQQAFDAVRSIPGAPEPPPLGNWGRYYLGLNLDEAAGDTAAAAAANSTASAGSAGAATTSTTAPAGAAGTQAGASTAAANSGSANAAKQSTGPAATKNATTTRRQAVNPSTGEVVDAAALGDASVADLAFGTIVTETRTLSTKDADVDPSDSTPLFLAGAAIALVVLAPPFLAAPAGALRRRRR